MTRHYALVQTAVWRPESTFCDLTADQQRMYLLLSSQHDISAAGVLTLAIDRWAGYARDTTAEDVRLAIKDLADAGHVIVDEHTQELLLRPFVAQDRGYNNPKRQPVIVRAAMDVLSGTLRAHLAETLSRIGIHIDGLAPPTVHGSDSESTPSACGPGPTDITGTSAFPQADSPSDGVSAYHGVAVFPQPTTLNTQPPTPDPVRALADRVRTIRPRWKITAVESAIRTALATGHTLAVIEAEFTALAADKATGPPGRLNADGRYWLTTEPAPYAPSTPPAVSTHDFAPSDSDPLACARCNMIRRSRYHGIAGETAIL